MDADFLNSYSQYLEDSDTHLSYEILSLYTNFPERLSKKEQRFIERHLGECDDCLGRFHNVFDEEIDFDDHKVSFTVNKRIAEGRHHRFENEEASFIVKIDQEENRHFYLLFEKLPQTYIGNRGRIEIPAIGAVLRIRSLRVQEKYAFVAATHSVSISDISNIDITSIKPSESASAASPSKLRNLYRYRWWAAAVAIVLFAGFVYTYWKGQEEPDFVEESKAPLPKPQEDPGLLIPQQTDSIKSVADETLRDEEPGDDREKQRKESYHSAFYAENFTAHPILEQAIKRNVRSGPEIDGVVPVNGDTLTAPVVFQWKSIEEVHKYGVVLLTNKNKKLWRGDTDAFSLSYGGELAPGLYYWKLELDGVTKKVQKFFISSQSK